MVDIVNEQKKRIRHLYSFMFRRYKANVTAPAEGGTIRSESITTDYLKMAQNNRMDKSIRFGWLGEAGSKITSGRVEKAHSFDFNNLNNHATQTTPTSRPYITGNIAPNEKLGLKNPNGGSNFMTHPTISFAANESWSITTVFNSNGFTDVATYLIGKLGTDNNSIRLWSGGDQISIRNNDGLDSSSIPNKCKQLVGKTNIIQFVASGNSTAKVYINGIDIGTLIGNTTNIIIDTFLGYTPTRGFRGQIKSHIIRSQALTQQQVTAECTYLRSVYPEIESVDIGTQTWATSNCEMAATPQGNVIQEMRAAGNVEKITNIADREFSSDTGFWTKSGETIIENGLCNIKTTAAATSGLEKLVLLTRKWYKLKYDVLANRNGGLQIYNGSFVQEVSSTVGNNKVFYFLAGGVYFNIARKGSIVDIDIDNISIQEIGWSGSQELYDGIYAQTAGTDEQKTYEAVKAAAMWCHYNNDVSIGAIYGKLYNWFAVKLLQMDIDYYNTANPTALWGWRVPTQADFQTLSTYLGGDAVSGGKLKLAGTTYWNSPNTGADNSSGFSVLGGGFRNTDGGYFNNGFILYITTISEISNTEIYRGVIAFDSQLFSLYLKTKDFGYSLRLIKS